MFKRDGSKAVGLALALSCCGLFWACEEMEEQAVTELGSAYLGQPLPGREAGVFAPGLVSLQGRHEYAVSFHPDGNLVLFTVEAPERGAAVYMSRIEDGSWTTPRPVSLTNGALKNEMEAFFSPDGRSLFFAPYSEGMDVRIWVADFSSDGWENPRPMGPPMDQDPAFYPVQSADGTLFYTNLAKRAVHRATVANGQVESVEAAGLERGGHAFPAPDGSYILVDSASLDEAGQRDIFVAFRRGDGTWGEPLALGSEVNTEHSETCPSLSPDGKLLFFSRYDEPGKISNIYWVSSEVVEDVAGRALSGAS